MRRWISSDMPLRSLRIYTELCFIRNYRRIFYITKKLCMIPYTASNKVTNGFEPMIRELQSHALPLG